MKKGKTNKRKNGSAPDRDTGGYFRRRIGQGEYQYDLNFSAMLDVNDGRENTDKEAEK